MKTVETIGYALIAWGVIILAVTYFIAKLYEVMPETALKYPWLPIGLGRRLIGTAIILFAIEQAAFSHNYQPFVYWLILPFFSPRIVVTAGYYGSRLSGLIRSESP